VFLRAMVGIATTIPVCLYFFTLVMIPVISDGNWSVEVIYGAHIPLGLALPLYLVLAVPFMVIGYLATRDMVLIASWCAQIVASAFALLFYTAMFIMMGGLELDPVNNPQSLFSIVCLMPGLLYLSWICMGNCAKYRARSATAATKASGTRKAEASRSRVGLLYDRHLGIRGKNFVWKVFVVQLMTVLLQTPSKLPTFAASSTIGNGAFGVNAAVQIPHLIFMGALVVNCLYPPILLRMSSVRWQREMAATCDVYLDCIYIWMFVLTMFTGDFSSPFPISPWAYLSCFWPVMHVFTAARALEAAVTHRVQEAQALASGRATTAMNVRSSRLPRWGAVLYFLLTMGFFVGSLMQTQYLWPFATPCGGSPRGWCGCSSDGTTLYTCRNVPATYTSGGFADFANRGLTTVYPRTFDKPSWTRIKAMSFVNNNLASLDPDTFAGPLGSVEYLDLGKNHLRTIDATLFSGLRGLRIVNLDNNAITSIAPGAFANNPLLELVLLRGNPVGCSTIQAELPEGAVCHERGFCDSTMCSAFCDESGDDFCYSAECKARAPPAEFRRSGQSPVVSTEEIAEDYGTMTCRNGLTPSPMLLLQAGEKVAYTCCSGVGELGLTYHGAGM
jgi:hypothetical protein